MNPRGRLLGGRYRLESVLGSGGMGRVWRAQDTLLQRPVAVKVLRSEFTGDPTFLGRFRAEAQHAALLNHPGIAAVHDYGEGVDTDTGEPIAYLVMELVAGMPLSALLARRGRLDVPLALTVLRQAADGLAAAHAAGVVHRDVKPANVLVSPDGTVKITDFGIAWSASSVPLTRTGQVMGTAHYLSPEQADGGKATPASDVYSLGVVAYECLAGRLPFEGDSPVQVALRQIRELPPPLPPDVPGPVRALVQRAMAKDPAARFRDGAAFREAVDGVAGGRPEPAPIADAETLVLTGAGAGPATAVLPGPAGGTAVPPADPPRPRRRSWVAVAGMALVTLLVLVGVLAVLGGNGSSGSAGESGATTRSATSPPATTPPATTPPATTPPATTPSATASPSPSTVAPVTPPDTGEGNDNRNGNGNGKGDKDGHGHGHRDRGDD